jgi:G3E family GTPase
VETTGLADPAPVLYSLTSDRDLRRWFSFGGIVATVDAVNADRTLGLHPECFKQIAVADRLVVTKADLCHDPASLRDLARIMGILRRLNPGAPILDRSAPDFDPARLFDASFHDLTAKPQNVTGWLNVDAYSSGRAEADDARPAATGARQGDRQAVNRHGADIRAFNLILDEPISSHAFATALELLVGFQGADLLRVKSIVCLREYPECPIIVHGVQHVFHDPVWLDRWPSADRRTRLVFITRNIRKDTVEAFFAAWRDADADPQTARPARRQGDGSRRSDPTARSMGG